MLQQLMHTDLLLLITSCDEELCVAHGHAWETDAAMASFPFVCRPDAAPVLERPILACTCTSVLSVLPIQV